VNPINPYTGNLFRHFQDIATYGAAPVTFERVYNSREQDFGGVFRDFGTNGGWQHNWNYELLHLSSQTHGFDDVRLRYPDGRDHIFKAKDTAGQELIPPARNGDRLYRWSGTTGYTLITPNCEEYDFQQTSSLGFILTQKRNGQSFAWTLTRDSNNKVERITNNFGRWIEIERGLVGGTEVVTKVKTDDLREVTFDYTAWTPTSEHTLISVEYPGGEEAEYTWVGADSLTTGRPLLCTADDPMYDGAGSRTKYVYNYSFTFDDGAGPYLVTGVVKEERNLVTDQVVVSLPDGSGPYPKILEGNGTEITRKFVYGRLVESRDGEGRTTTYAYDAAGEGFLRSITEPNGGVTKFTRDPVGRIFTEKDALNGIRTWCYNPDGFVFEYVDKRNNSTAVIRDSSNRPTRRNYPGGTYETWTYNTNGLPLTHRLRNTGTNTYTYNTTGNIATFKDAENQTWTYTYDTSGQLATATDPRSNTTSYSYDWRGQLLSITHPDSTVRSFEYDDYGNRTKVTDELNKVTEYTYNEYNRLVSVEDPLNRTTEYEYGREPGCSSCGFSSVITKVTLPSGRIVENTYDLSWKPLTRVEAPGTSDEAVTTLAYNAGGDVQSVTNPENETTTFTYDLLHRRLTATDPLSQTTTWTYDANGNVLTEKLADNSQTTFVYDTMNRLTKKTDALSQVTQFTYNGGDKLLTLKDARNNTYTWQYDKRNLPTRLTYPGGSYEQWAYDGARNLATYRTRAAEVLTVTSDSRNRDTLLDWSGSTTPDVSKTYDNVGRVLTIDNANSEVTFTYDDAGQLLAEEQKVLAPGLTKTVSYTYNTDGLRSSLTYPDTKAFSYTYTQRNQLADIDFNLLSLNPLVHYDYDLAGRRTARTLNNVAETEYTYDGAGRLTALEQKNAGGTFDRRDYGYNVVNNRTWEKRDSLLGDAYTYDTIRQVTGVQYDAVDPDTTPSNPFEQTAFDYDAVGNREIVTHTTGTNAPVNTNYTANTLNQYTAVGGNTVTSDTNGNLATTASGTYAYDAQNRLTSVNSGTNTISLAYDGLNRAVTRTVNGTATHLIYDRDWNVIEEYDGSGVQLAAMAYGAATDEPIFRWASGPVLSYYHQDALGNVTTLTDTSGIPVESYRYDIYGQPTIYDPYLSVRATSFFGNPYMFTGREYLTEVGLYQYRNRAYLPEFGRFLQTDPIGFAAGDESLYRLCFNDPINMTDPFGLDAYLGWYGDTKGGHVFLVVDTPGGNVAKFDFVRKGYDGSRLTGNNLVDAWNNYSGEGQATVTMGRALADVVPKNSTIYQIETSPEADLAMFGKMIEKSQSPPRYNLLSNNCGDQVEEILGSQGYGPEYNTGPSPEEKGGYYGNRYDPIKLPFRPIKPLPPY